MDQDRFKEFEQRVNRALTDMDAKISHLHNTTGEMKNSFGDFQEEMSEFMKFMAEYVTDHEQRLKRLEKNAGIG